MNLTGRTILVATDMSTQGRLALDEGINAASAFRNTQLHVLMVVDSEESLDHAGTNLNQYVKSALETAKERDIEVWNQVITHVAAGKVAVQIVQLATDLHADVIMMGTHGRTGVQRLVVGSIAESVVRTAPCPVLVVREKDFTSAIPEIQPPCPECVKTREASNGQKLWCAQHSERHGRRHTYFNKLGPSGRPPPYSGGIAP